MTNKPELKAIPETDFSKVQNAVIKYANYGVSPVVLTFLDGTVEIYNQDNYGRDAVIKLQELVKSVASTQGIGLFYFKAKWDSYDSKVWFFNAPTKIKALSKAQKETLSRIAWTWYENDWLIAYDLLSEENRDDNVIAHKCGFGISTLRKLIEYGYIKCKPRGTGINNWDSFYITESGLQYVESKLPENNKAIVFDILDKREISELARDNVQDVNREIVKKVIIRQFNHFLNMSSLSDVSQIEGKPFHNTTFTICNAIGSQVASLKNGKISMRGSRVNRNSGNFHINVDNARIIAEALNNLYEVQQVIDIWDDNS